MQYISITDIKNILQYLIQMEYMRQYYQNNSIIPSRFVNQ